MVVLIDCCVLCLCLRGLVVLLLVWCLEWQGFVAFMAFLDLWALIALALSFFGWKVPLFAPQLLQPSNNLVMWACFMHAPTEERVGRRRPAGHPVTSSISTNSS